MTRAILVFFAAALSIAACTGPAGEPGPPGAQGAQGVQGPPGVGAVSPEGGAASCTPNAQVGCQCAPGASGFQTCAADGLSFGACACGDGGALSDGGADGSALSDGSTDAESGTPFSVGSLPGLVVWLKGDQGIVDDLQKPGRVKRWLDQSGNTNHAEAYGSEGAVHDPQALNGIDVVDFNVSNQGLAFTDSVSLKIGTGEYAMVWLARIQPTNSPFTLLGKGGGSFFITTSAQPGQLQVNSQASVALPGPIPSWQIYSVRGPNLRLKAGTNSATGTATTNDISAGADPWIFGGLYEAKLAEAIIIKGPLSDSDLASTEAYLKAKYGL